MDSSLVGYFRLVQQMIMLCFEKPKFSESLTNKLESKRARRTFAQSPLLHMWCDIAGLSFRQVSNAILNANK